MGLGPPEEPRLNAVNMAPRLCHMSAGGPRRFSVGDAEFARAVSPYELEFPSEKHETEAKTNAFKSYIHKHQSSTSNWGIEKSGKQYYILTDILQGIELSMQHPTSLFKLNLLSFR